MSCLQVHDFITGSKITLAQGCAGMQDSDHVLDIVRPNGEAEAVVSAHMAQLQALQAHRRAVHRPSQITAIVC
jgi:hypothetical protein